MTEQRRVPAWHLLAIGLGAGLVIGPIAWGASGTIEGLLLEAIHRPWGNGWFCWLLAVVGMVFGPIIGLGLVPFYRRRTLFRRGAPVVATALTCFVLASGALIGQMNGGRFGFVRFLWSVGLDGGQVWVTVFTAALMFAYVFRWYEDWWDQQQAQSGSSVQTRKSGEPPTYRIG